MRARLATILILLHVASASLAAYGAVAMGAAGGAGQSQHAMAHVSAPSTDNQMAHEAHPPGHCDPIPAAMADEEDGCELGAGCMCCYLCCTLVVSEPELGSPAAPGHEAYALKTAEAPAGVSTPIYRPPRS